MNPIIDQINQRGKNLLSVGVMRQREDENRRQNALTQQKIGLYEQANALDQQKFDADQSQYEDEQKTARTNQIADITAKAIEFGEGDPNKTQEYYSMFGKMTGMELPANDFSGVKKTGKSTIGLDMGNGRYLDITGPTSDVNAVLTGWGRTAKTREDALRLAKDYNVSLSQRELKKEKVDKPTAADKKFEYEKQQTAITNYADNYVSENLEGITKDKNGTYGRYVMDDTTGEERFMPLTGDERKFVSYAQKRARAIAARAKNKGISFDEAAYDYEVAMSRAEQAAKDKEELKNRAAANTPQSSKKAEKPKVKDKAVNDFAKEGADNPITKYLTNELGSSWTFGKSAKEIAEELKKR